MSPSFLRIVVRFKLKVVKSFNLQLVFHWSEALPHVIIVVCENTVYIIGILQKATLLQNILFLYALSAFLFKLF